MAKFKHQNGGIAEVFTELNINRLRADKNYTEIPENAQLECNKPIKKVGNVQKTKNIVHKSEEVEEKPLQ